MIDIHTHLLPEVDDGSSSIDASLEMARNLVEEGVSIAVLSPHYRGRYTLEKSVLEQKFNDFSNLLEKENIPLKVFLGQEIYITSDYKKKIREGETLGINQGKYVLCEFSFDKDGDVADIVYEIKTMGYKPIVAHLERYSYADLDTAFEIKECGGYIQLNAGSIVSPANKKQKKLIKALFKEKLVDFVASDVHEFREPLMKKAYVYVQKKFGKEIADKVFIENAKEIIEG